MPGTPVIEKTYKACPPPVLISGWLVSKFKDNFVLHIENIDRFTVDDFGFEAEFLCSPDGFFIKYAGGLGPEDSNVLYGPVFGDGKFNDDVTFINSKVYRGLGISGLNRDNRQEKLLVCGGRPGYEAGYCRYGET